jgi:hypothetical protein
MKKNAFYFGLLGVILFVITTIIAGIVYPNYSHLSQFISESYAADATYADPLRFYGYIPSGSCFILFCYFSNAYFPKSTLKTLSLIGIGLGYGLGTIICGIFNCDAGCNPDFVNPSVSQIIHNLSGMLTYLIVPISILGFGIASRKWSNSALLTNISLIVAVLSFVFMVVLNQNLDSDYKGLIQRIIEGSILVWFFVCAIHISKENQHATTP